MAVVLGSSFNPPALDRPAEPLGVIGALVPARARAETFFDVPESTMFSAEAATVANAVPRRRLEFATVRHCARRALRQLGISPVPILPDADRVPQWPDGIVGSMTHCAGYRAAVVARSNQVHGIGIDAEPHAALPDAAGDVIVRAEERRRLRELSVADPELRWDRILLCAKEALFKAWFPLTRRWLDFDDISVTLRPGGTFRACLRAEATPAEKIPSEVLTGRWVVGRGLVAAATWVTR